jgi:hypothetical protein
MQAMARFFFHFRNGTEAMADQQGIELVDAGAARSKAVQALRDILADDLRGGVLHAAAAIEIEDEDHRPVGIVTLEQAVKVIGAVLLRPANSAS